MTLPSIPTKTARRPFAVAITRRATLSRFYLTGHKRWPELFRPCAHQNFSFTMPRGGYITMGGWMTTGKIPSRSPAKNLGKPWTPFYLGSQPLCPSTLLWGALSSGEPPRLDLYFLFTFAAWLANPTSACTSASTAPAKKLINGVLGRLFPAVKTTNFKLET